MLSIDPLLFEQKVIRISTSSASGQQQHIIRTAQYSNSHIRNGRNDLSSTENNNNNIGTLTADNFVNNDFSRRTVARNFNEMSSSISDEMMTSDQQMEWPSEQMMWGEGEVTDMESIMQQNSSSMMSFQSDLTNSSTSFNSQTSEMSESKEEVINALLNKVRQCESKVEACRILSAMSNTPENCSAMRQCGCLPLLIQLLHNPDENSNEDYGLLQAKTGCYEVRERAGQVLHNVVLAQVDDKRGRREARVLRLLEQVRDYCDHLRCVNDVDDNRNDARSAEQQIGPTVAALMKLSFDEDHRHAMCQLGGLQSMAELLQVEQEVHGTTSDQLCTTVRRYCGMALTNLTFGDGTNKALLCSMRGFMEALVAQLYSPSEDLRQVTASVLRNLSWRADPSSKRILREVGAVSLLTRAAVAADKESTLKSILSALWNLSAHCSANKADICAEKGALAFLVSTLTYKSKSRTLAIVENGGGILRNVSSHIAIQNEYRAILRKHNCLQILLQHLKSPSLTVVSNACGALWNLSARNQIDQRALWEMGAVSMLKKLINSKHKMISMGSSAALKNLLSARPPGAAFGICDNFLNGDGSAPSLMVRKQKALSAEIDENLAETFDNTDSPKTSPVKHAPSVNENRTRLRHISPSARHMLANQKLRNELSLPHRPDIVFTTQKFSNELSLPNSNQKLSLPNRSESTVLANQKQQNKPEANHSSVVVEERHNGAFQVMKNAKQPLTYKSTFAQKTTDKKPQHLKHSSSSVDRQIVPPTSVRKETRTITNTAQAQRFEPKPKFEPAEVVLELNQKQGPESKIPLPRSSSKQEYQRSQSASPQRRSQTHPKAAWNAPSEKQDLLSEKPTIKRHSKADDAPKQEKLFVSRASAQNAESYQNHQHLVSQTNQPNSNENQQTKFAPKMKENDEHQQRIFVVRRETKDFSIENDQASLSHISMPSVAPLLNDMDDLTGPGRCSLNIKTSTGVKMIKNHPLLANANAHRRENEDSGLFPSRNLILDDHFEGGKTVEFSVQSDYDFEEPLSMLSRSVSLGSIGSADQDDVSITSDISRHSDCAVSPSELSDSMCQTAMSSPSKRDVQSPDDFMSARSELSALTSQTSSMHVSEIKKQFDSTPTENLKEKYLNETEEFTLISEPENELSKRQMLIKDKMSPIDYNLVKTRIQEKEEKGKEDERKAEKNRLFRIPESPIDKSSEDSNKIIDVSSNDMINNKVFVDLQGNRRCEKTQQVKSCVPQGNAQTVEEIAAHQLEFLMNACKTRQASTEKEQNAGEAPQTLISEQRTENNASEISTSVLNEAKEVAEALFAARADSTEDMTVSSLSCLSDLDNARPPSIMAEIGSISINDSEENLKVAVAKECSKLFGKSYANNIPSNKMSLLRELQMGRLAAENDCSKHSDDLKGSCASDLLGNVNPPSMLDDISLTSSIDGSDSELEADRNFKCNLKQVSTTSQRLTDAAVLAQLYAKELSNITGNAPQQQQTIVQLEIPVHQETVETADLTELGCETIGSDSELEEDFPCDDDTDFCLQTVQKNDCNSDEGTFALDQQNHVLDNNDCLMTTEEFKALQESADRILSTLKDVEISDEEDNGGTSNADMLEDETMSLVSNESDDEFISPDGTTNKNVPHKAGHLVSPSCNAMVALPQCSSFQRSSLPQFVPKTKLPVFRDIRSRNININEDIPFKDIPCSVKEVDRFVKDVEECRAFDTRTFTRKRMSFPKEAIPEIHPSVQAGPSSGNTQEFSAATKPTENKISGIWKNGCKGRSKSAGDAVRNAELHLFHNGNRSNEIEPEEWNLPQRSSSLEPKPTHDSPSDTTIRRPTSLALPHQNTDSAKQHNGLPAPQTIKNFFQKQNIPQNGVAALSPTTQDISKAQNKSSFIPSRVPRSMIPQPAKYQEH